jgi:hypothetical protein
LRLTAIVVFIPKDPEKVICNINCLKRNFSHGRSGDRVLYVMGISTAYEMIGRFQGSFWSLWGRQVIRGGICGYDCG